MKTRKQNGEFMKRSRLYRLNQNEKIKNEKTYRRNSLLAAATLGFFFAILLSKFFKVTKITSPEALETKIEVKAVEVAKPFCRDVIACIRDVGEELGFSNKDILIAINISRAESNFRADAIGVNTNKSVDRGCMQINSIHKRLSNKDAFDYEKNIRFAYQLRKEQGNWNAWSTCHNGKVDCR